MNKHKNQNISKYIFRKLNNNINGHILMGNSNPQSQVSTGRKIYEPDSSRILLEKLKGRSMSPIPKKPFRPTIVIRSPPQIVSQALKPKSNHQIQTTLETEFLPIPSSMLVSTQSFTISDRSHSAEKQNRTRMEVDQVINKHEELRQRCSSLLKNIEILEKDINQSQEQSFSTIEFHKSRDDERKDEMPTIRKKKATFKKTEYPFVGTEKENLSCNLLPHFKQPKQQPRVSRKNTEEQRFQEQQIQTYDFFSVKISMELVSQNSDEYEIQRVSPISKYQYKISLLRRVSGDTKIKSHVQGPKLEAGSSHQSVNANYYLSFSEGQFDQSLVKQARATESKKGVEISKEFFETQQKLYGLKSLQFDNKESIYQIQSRGELSSSCASGFPDHQPETKDNSRATLRFDPTPQLRQDTKTVTFGSMESQKDTDMTFSKFYQDHMDREINQIDLQIQRSLDFLKDVHTIKSDLSSRLRTISRTKLSGCTSTSSFGSPVSVSSFNQPMDHIETIKYKINYVDTLRIQMLRMIESYCSQENNQNPKQSFIEELQSIQNEIEKVCSEIHRFICGNSELNDSNYLHQSFVSDLSEL